MGEYQSNPFWKSPMNILICLLNCLLNKAQLVNIQEEVLIKMELKDKDKVNQHNYKEKPMLIQLSYNQHIN